MKQESTLVGLLSMLEATSGKLSLSLFQKSDEFTWSKRAEFPITEGFMRELEEVLGMPKLGNSPKCPHCLNNHFPICGSDVP